MADRWTDSGFTGWQAATSTRPALVTSQFIIEDMGPQPADGTCHLQIPVEPTCLVPLYRVTAQARATNSRGTIVTLQSNIRQ
jgi:Tfp pilus assembly protein PilX